MIETELILDNRSKVALQKLAQLANQKNDQIDQNQKVIGDKMGGDDEENPNFFSVMEDTQKVGEKQRI